MRAELKNFLLAYLFGSLFMLCGLSILLPPEVELNSKLLFLMDRWAGNIVVDAALMAESSGHPAALKITYLVMISLALLGGLVLAVFIGRDATMLVGFFPRDARLSKGFIFLAAVLVVSTPFLPLGLVELPVVQLIQDWIKNSRSGLAIWMCLFFVVQAAMWLCIFIYVFYRLRGA